MESLVIGFAIIGVWVFVEEMIKAWRRYRNRNLSAIITIERRMT